MRRRRHPSSIRRIGAALAAALATLGVAGPAGATTHPPPEGAPPRPADVALPEPEPEPEPEPQPTSEPEPEPDADADDTVRTITVPSRSDGLTATGRTIDARTIAGTPKRSAEDLLRLVPGVVIVQHGNQGKGYQFYLRGFDAAHGSDVEVSLEDVPLNEPSNVHAHGYLDLAFIIPEVVDGVDAKKGAFRLEQGNFGTAGSIQYRLGVPKEDRGVRTTYEVGSTNRHRGVLVYAPRKQPEETFFAAEAMRDSGYGENREAMRVSALSQMRLYRRHGAYVDGLGSIYASRFGLPGLVRHDDVTRGDVGFYDAYRTDTGGESDRAIVGLRGGVDRGKIHAGVAGWAMARRLALDENFTGDLLFPETGDRHLQRQEAISGGLRGHYEHDVHPRVRLLAGAELRGDVIAQSQEQLTLTGQPWSLSRDVDIRQLHFGVAPGVRALPADWMVVEGGVRLDVFHYDVVDRLQDDRRFRDTFFAASPRVAMRFQPLRRWQLFAAYGRGLRSPEARAITGPREPPSDVDLSRFVGGQPRMTLTDNAEIGTRVQPGELFDVGAAVFGNWIDRESVFDHVSGFNVELAATQRLGVEADVQIRPTDWLVLGGDFTYVRARFRESGNPVPGAPPIVTSVFGNLAHPSGWRAGVRWFLLGPRPLTYGATAGVMTVLDASAGYRWRFLDIGVSVDNALGLRWREGEYHFASHWNPERPRSEIPTIHYVAGYPFGVRLALSAFF